MKPLRQLVGSLMALLGIGAITVSGGTLTIAMDHTWRGAPLDLGALMLTEGPGVRLSVTRLDYLMSEFVLEAGDGSRVPLEGQAAYVSAGGPVRRFVLRGVPVGRYETLRFRVGLNPEVNHRDPTLWPAGDPLNPNVNGLHWNWQGGYVFLALEGHWLPADGRREGYSYHLATDRLSMAVEIPLRLELTGDVELGLGLAVERIFSGRHSIKVARETATSHSRPGDTLAERLSDNVSSAFTLVSVRAVPAPVVVARTAVREIGAAATPYRFTFSRSFPNPVLPGDNPLTEEGVALGRRLFHDPSLSINGRQSCASCHLSGRAFADAGRQSVGALGQVGTRNAQPLMNLAWKSSYFWDGRAPTLRDQVLRPIQDPAEMHETLTNVVLKLDAVATNRALFAAAFGTPEITPDRIARALEQFLLTQVSQPSKFDRWLTGAAELTAQEQRGFELFHTEYDPRREQFGADCFHCHGGPLFQSQSFANNGLDAKFADPGRGAVTGRPADAGTFAVPSLRNVAITGPYMHDGRFDTLDEVVAHYAAGIQRSATLDPNLAKHPDGGVPLTVGDRQALVAFLRTLTEDRFVPGPLAEGIPGPRSGAAGEPASRSE